MRPLAVLISLLVLLCLIIPDVYAADQTSKQTNKQPIKQSQKPVKTESDASEPIDPYSSTTPEALRLARKQQRINQSINRLNQQEKRVTDQSKKLASRYVKSAQLRGEKNKAKAAKTKRLNDRSAAYWTMKRESLAPANVKKATERLTTMRKYAEAALDAVDQQSNNQSTTKKQPIKKSALLSLKSTDVNKLIVAAPRPFWTLLSLTALDTKYKCEICQRAHVAMANVAEIAHRHNIKLYGRLNQSNDQSITQSIDLSTPLLDFNSSVSIADREIAQRAADEHLKGNLPVFVVELDIDSNRQLFNDLQLTTAPLIVLLPPILSTRKVGPAQLLDGLPNKYKFIPQSLDIPPQAFTDFINQAINSKIGPNTESAESSLSLTQQLMNKVDQSINGLRATWKQTDKVIQSYAIAILTMLSLFALNQLYRFITSKDKSGGLIGFLFPPINNHVIKETVIVEHIHLQSNNQSNNQSIDRDIISKTQEEVPVVHNLFPVPSASRLRLIPLTTYPLVAAVITFYFFCVSGGIFTLIKGSERGYREFGNLWSKGGATISGQYMDQTVAESALVASMYAAMALLFALISLLSFSREPVVDETQSNKITSSARKWIIFIIASLSAFVVAGLIFFMYCQIVNVYGKKTNYQWGTNWKFLQKLDWNKLIPYPSFHRYVKIAWTMVKSKLL